METDISHHQSVSASGDQEHPENRNEVIDPQAVSKQTRSHGCLGLGVVGDRRNRAKPFCQFLCLNWIDADQFNDMVGDAL